VFRDFVVNLQDASTGNGAGYDNSISDIFEMIIGRVSGIASNFSPTSTLFNGWPVAFFFKFDSLIILLFYG
jgi:hypothetical protein